MSPTETQKTNDFAKILRGEAQAAIQQWREQHSTKNYWQEPLLAVARADDPIFPRLREVASPEHAMPRDLLSGADSVIVFFLPFQKILGQENDEAGPFAARSWAEAYVTTNRLIESVNIRLKACLEQAGHLATITPATHNFDTQRLVSGWSHKHVAYIAGLGTFGINHLLITRAGCCGRLGSLVTSMPLPPTPRPDEEWCLTKAGRKCLACVTKCSYGALHKSHFDRHLCYEQCLRNDAHYEDLPLVDVCGKCSCGVPCSHGIPTQI
jgi:epoxyqueuosine reductase QueG